MANSTIQRHPPAAVRWLLDVRTTKTVLFFADMLFINLMYYISYLIRYEMEFPYPVPPQYDAPFGPYLPYGILLTITCLFAYNLDGIYDARRRKRNWADEAYGLVNGTTTSIVIVMAVTFFIQPAFYSRGMLVLAGVLIIIALSVMRLLVKSMRAELRRRGIGVEQLLIIGAGETGRAVMRTILADPSLGYRVAGYLDDDDDKSQGRLGRISGLGKINDVESALKQSGIDEVIITLPWESHSKIMKIVSACDRLSVRVRVVPDVFQQRLSNIDFESLNGIPLMGGSSSSALNQGNALTKRLIDYVISLALLPIFAVLFVFIAVLIKIDSPGPVFFKQRRTGKDGRQFDVYKFRSMIDGADELKETLADQNEDDGPQRFKIRKDPRVTRVGKILRKTSLDELPQLINVLRGEMSLVGPRPAIPDEVLRYKPWQLKRLSVLPGITGLWQVSGRSDMPFDEGCLLDVFYIENWSIDLDIRILLQTIPSVITGSGAY